MISLSIDVKESAYDNIIYLLSHLKDDVIIHHPSKERPSMPQNPDNRSQKVKEQLAMLDSLVAQSDNRVTLTRELAIDTDGIVRIK